MRFIKDLDIGGKRLVIREDYNVPLKDGRITDDNRIRASLKTIGYCLEQGASLVLCSHLGKPKGQVVPELSLRPVAERLGELLGREVRLAPDCVGDETRALAEGLKPGEVLLLENLRFDPRETGKSADDRGDFGQKLAGLGDIYVFDAFGVAHRENASVVDAPAAARACCGGLLLQKEWEYLGQALQDPARPFVAVSGGAKVSTKLGILHRLIGRVDDIIIGGAMANTFLLAQGKAVGDSRVEADLVDAAGEIMAKAEAGGTALHLPQDFLWAGSADATSPAGTCTADAVPGGAVLLDIGPETIEAFSAVLARAKTIVWNGPMGLFETEAFAQGSLAVARAMAGNADALTIVGGGDTDAMIHNAGLVEQFSFLSTGGGSFMEFLEGKELPAFKALKECAR